MTQSGCTTSSPPTQSIIPLLKPLEEAPFREYLRILRENDRGEDADISEELYMGLLTTPFEDGSAFTREQVYSTPFRDLVKAAERILTPVAEELKKSAPAPPVFSGVMMRGADADKLSPDQLNALAARQAAMLEAEKERLRLG